MTFGYQAFGLSIASDFPLPELLPGAVPPTSDLVIERGDLPSGTGDHAFRVEGDTADLWVAEAGAAFRMQGGTRMIVHCEEAEPGRNVRLYLLGSALAAILHQRGLLPLHACALELNGHAYAFMGHPGAGKSTLAAWLVDQGALLLSDDVCVIRWTPEGAVMASLGIPRLRLWKDAIEARGLRAEDYPRSFDDWDKRDLPGGDGVALNAAPLRHLFLLEPGDELALERVRGAEAVGILSANTYRGSYVAAMGRQADHLDQCVQLARTLPVTRLRRPLDHGRMMHDYSVLLERLSQLAD